MANRNYKSDMMTDQKAIVKLFGEITFGSSGAVSDTELGHGIESIVKTATETGRYTVTLKDKFNALKAFSACLEGAADTALTTADGVHAVLRGVDLANKVLYIQMVRTDTGADANPTDGHVLRFEMTFKNSATVR